MKKAVVAGTVLFFFVVALLWVRLAVTPQADFRENESLVELKVFGSTSDQWLGKSVVVHIEFGRGQSQTIKCPVEKQKIKYAPKAEAFVNYFWCSTWIPKGSYFISLSTDNGEILTCKHGSTWWPWDSSFFGSQNCGFSLK